MWPDDSQAAARASQAAFANGHQPWRGNVVEVASLYARQVYGWSDPLVSRVGTTNTYRVSQRNSPDSIVIHTVKPFGEAAASIVEIAETR